jgi:hypothetical protein
VLERGLQQRGRVMARLAAVPLVLAATLVGYKDFGGGPGGAGDSPRSFGGLILMPGVVSACQQRKNAVRAAARSRGGSIMLMVMKGWGNGRQLSPASAQCAV